MIRQRYSTCLNNSVSQSVVRVPRGVKEEFWWGTRCTRVWWGYALHRALLHLILRSYESSQDSLARQPRVSLGLFKKPFQLSLLPASVLQLLILKTRRSSSKPSIPL
ncbi:hypothetical protein TNCV_556871 [Trichonephila clavipes]|uniref:Uncharacterized protein n=1 Tax=Trichonephila clavipes TaxID=2585209 RepID=A0A8X6RYD2_TRICX|nr:hypothetical protein TNCV_556871 [Trichonephila clavipes]